MVSPIVAQKAPYLVEVEAGKTYYWCSCGLSKSQPFCDGSHKGTELTPLPYVATETKKVAMCGCKYSKTGQLCDGSHKSL
jgi:CDGSH iron-sulfur domain-containing protein 3